MSEVRLKCVEVANLLADNVIPKLESEYDLNITKYNNKKDYVIYVLQLVETFNSSDQYVIINTDDLYYKLRELADTVIFSDVGEVSTFQSSLYDKLNEICVLINPDDNYEKEIRINKLGGYSLSPSSASLSDILLFDEVGDDVSRFQDPVYERIADIINSLVHGSASKDDHIFDKIDSLINLLDVKSPIRCKTAILNRLDEVNDAINSISKGENVVFTSYLQFQIDEIYTLLKKDAFSQKQCFLTEIKIAILAMLHNVKNLTCKKFDEFFNMEKRENFCWKIFHVYCKLLANMKEFVSSKCKEIFDSTCILITIVHLFVLGTILF